MRWTSMLALAMVSGCAAPAYVAGLRPAGGTVDRLDARDQVSLLHQSWRAPQPRAVVLLVHGLKDHSDRYEGFAKQLVAAGYSVHAFDLRGHGDSTGDRVWVERFDDYLDDVDVVLDEVRRVEGAGKRVFLFGHSMGGAIVTLYALTRSLKPDGIVLSAAALKVNESGFTQGSTKVLGAVLPTLAVFSLDDQKFSRDAEVVAEMKRDPLIYDDAAPAHTAAEVLHAVDRIQELSPQLDVPVLALHGTADTITPPEGSRALISAAKSTDKTLKTYEGLFHDLLHEPEKQQVIDDIVQWLNQRTK